MSDANKPYNFLEDATQDYINGAEDRLAKDRIKQKEIAIDILEQEVVLMKIKHAKKEKRKKETARNKQNG